MAGSKINVRGSVATKIACSCVAICPVGVSVTAVRANQSDLRAVAETACAFADIASMQLNATLPPRTKDGKAVSKPVTAAVARDEAFGGETVLVILY